MYSCLLCVYTVPRGPLYQSDIQWMILREAETGGFLLSQGEGMPLDVF